MTTVVGYGDGQTVWMAADTATNVYERPIVGAATKILRLDAGDDEVLLGMAGAGGLASVLPSVTLPMSPEDDEVPQAWANKVALTLTQMAVEHGLVEDGKLDGIMLLGWNGLLWTITHAMAIPHPDGCAALGSGEGPAIGALDAFLLRGEDPAVTVRLAAEIACRRDRYSMPPVQVEILSRSDPYAEVAAPQAA